MNEILSDVKPDKKMNPLHEDDLKSPSALLGTKGFPKGGKEAKRGKGGNEFDPIDEDDSMYGYSKKKNMMTN